jgi:hypothetical protein
VSRNWSERKVAWLIAGVGLGVALATYWPHENEALASQTAVSGEKFAMCTVETNVGDTDAVFILDFATGRLVGGIYNRQNNTFSQPMFRNIAQDFNAQEKATYIMATGFVGATSRGAQPASGGVYVAELTSGQLVLYGFVSARGNNAAQQLTPMGNFAWRAAAN